MAAKKGKNANYDFARQKEPLRNMGQSSFANMPEKPMLMGFGKATYRDGLINSFSASIDEISEIHENQR